MGMGKAGAVASDRPEHLTKVAELIAGGYETAADPYDLAFDILTALRLSALERVEAEQDRLREALAEARAVGDSLQSSASRLAEYVLKLQEVDAIVPYEVQMAGLEALAQVEEWTEFRVAGDVSSSSAGGDRMRAGEDRVTAEPGVVRLDGQALGLEAASRLADALNRAVDDASPNECICMVEYRPCPVHRVDRVGRAARLMGRGRP